MTGVAVEHEAPRVQPYSPITRIREEHVLAERMSLLEEAPLFSVLHPADLRVLASKFHPVRYRRGGGIFREGENAEQRFLIRDWRGEPSPAPPTGHGPRL